MLKRLTIGILCLLAVLALSRYIYMEEIGNFHEVSKGLVYRSAQLDEDELVKYIGKYGIRSILNLRGKKEDRKWYQEEMAVAQRMGVILLNYRLSPRKLVSPPILEKILQLIKEAPKPILIHCKAGADRSGLLAAVWRLVVEKDPPEKAHKQLSLFYGHVPYLWSKSKAMDESFWNYVTYLQNQAERLRAENAETRGIYPNLLCTRKAHTN